MTVQQLREILNEVPADWQVRFVGQLHGYPSDYNWFNIHSYDIGYSDKILTLQGEEE